MPKSYKPLTDDELMDMHGRLREQFEYANRMLGAWEKYDYFKESNTTNPKDLVNGYNVASPIVTAMASAAEALVAVDRELKERGEEKRRVTLPKPKPN